MARKIIDNNLDDNSANNHNHNYKELYESREMTERLNKRADSILKTSQNANSQNKDVQQQIDSLILSDGESDAEVIQARGEFTVLRERLDESDRNFKGVGRNRNTSLGVYNRRSPKGTLVILDDDTRKTSYNILYQYAKENNVPITLAANSSHIMDRESNRINIEEFLEMKDDPLVEFVNHTHTHARLTDLTEEQIHDEIRLCEEFLYSHGIYTKHLVYPYGAVNDTVKQIAHQYVDSASKSSGLNISPSGEVLDSFQLNRIVFEEEIGTFNNRINKAAAEGGCVLINSHSQYDTFSISKLDEILTLARNAGLDIVHYSEAFRRFGNIVELRNEDGSLKDGISAGGHAEGIFKKEESNFTYALSGDIDINTDPSAYPVNKVTGMNITSAKATASGFPGAGRLYTSQSGPDDYTFQLFHPIKTDDVMKRHWNNDQKVWSNFKKIGGDSKKKKYVSGPHTIPSKGVQNIIIADENVKRGDIIAYTLNAVLNNNVTMSGPFIEVDGQIRFRLYNISDVESTIPEFEIYTKII